MAPFENDTYLTICIEFRCNNRCSSCMLRGIRRQLTAVSFKQYQDIIRKNGESRQYSGLILSGAEVTLNDRLLDYVRVARDSGAFRSLRIQTNGRRLANPDYCKELIAGGINEFFVSLYGDTPQVHDSLTGVPGSFGETLAGLENLEREPVRMFTNTVMTAWNYASLPGIGRLVSRFSRLREMHFWNYWPMGAEDDVGLVASLGAVRPYLLQALREGGADNRQLVVKNYPECLLGSYRGCLDNSQAATIIDKKYWEKFHLNNFGRCSFRNSCLSDNCAGLTAAYVDKFGWEKDLLKPLAAPAHS